MIKFWLLKKVCFRNWSPKQISIWHFQHVKGAGLLKITRHVNAKILKAVHHFETSDYRELYIPVGGANRLHFEWKCNLKLWCNCFHCKRNSSTCSLTVNLFSSISKGSLMYPFCVHFSCVLFHRYRYGDIGTGELRGKTGGGAAKTRETW